MEQSAELSTGSTNPFISNHPWLSFIFIKTLPFIVYLVIVLTNFKEPNISLVIFLISQIIEFVLTKNQLGLKMTGLKWNIDPEKNDSIIQYYAKPAPFIPSVVLSNTFWIGFFASIVIWVVCLFINIFKARLLGIIICAVGIACQAINLILFTNAHHSNQKEITSVAMNIKEDVLFELVNEEESKSEQNSSNEST